MPPLAHSYVTGNATTQAAVDAAWTAQHQFGGALLGEHLGQLLAIGWSVTVSIIIVRTLVLPRWLGIAGIAVSAMYLFNQGDILATAVAGFPVWDLGGLIGSTTWGLWVAALGVTLWLPRPTAWQPAKKWHDRWATGRWRASDLSAQRWQARRPELSSDGAWRAATYDDLCAAPAS